MRRRPPRRRGSRLGLALGSILVLLLSYFLGARYARGPQPELSGYLLPEPQALPGFRLRDHWGGPFTNASLQHRWSLLLVGRSDDPACAPLLVRYVRVLNRLAARRDLLDQLQVVFVALDAPPDLRLQGDLGRYHPDFLGVTGEPQALRRLARGLGVPREAIEGGNLCAPGADYASLSDRRGRLRLLWSGVQAPADIARDLTWLFDHQE